MRKPKQVIVMRKDLNMRKGKMIAQGAHASLKVLLDAASRSGDAVASAEAAGRRRSEEEKRIGRGIRTK